MTRKRMEGIAQLVCKAGMDVEIVEVNKINGTRLGLVLKGATVAPTLYLDELEEESDEMIVEFVLRTMNECKNVELDIDDLFQPENVIGFVVNRRQNETWLENIPHMDILDLSIGFRFSKDERSCIISNQIAKMYGYSVERLYELAITNSTPQIASMESLLREFGMDIPDSVGMMVVTNRNRYYGAFESFLKENLDIVADELESDLIILPSSIHECILLPFTDFQLESLREMVGDVNDSVVSQNEVLSNNIYIYSRDTRELKIS